MRDDSKERSLEVVEKVLKDLISELTLKAKVEYGDIDSALEFFHLTTFNLLTSLICTMIYNKLSSSMGQNEEKALRDYKEYKSIVENCIASGFQTAMTDFTGKDTDYECQVLPLPQPTNDKYPC